MPGAAWEIGAVQSLHPLPQISERIISLVNQRVEPVQLVAQSS
jgi:chemotaxis response regulator CheB